MCLINVLTTIILSNNSFTYHSNGVSDANDAEHHGTVIIRVPSVHHVLSQIEVRHYEPHKQDNGAKTEQIESHLLEEFHIEHVSEAVQAVVVPVLKNEERN